MNYDSKTYIDSSKYPIRFDRQHPGTLFKVHAERSRGMNFSRDQRVYRKAREHEGFYAVNVANGEAACFYPEDMVQPVKEVR